jgi:hypothetical protein
MNRLAEVVKVPLDDPFQAVIAVHIVVDGEVLRWRVILEHGSLLY